MRYLLIYNNEVYFQQFLNLKEIKECLTEYLENEISMLAIKELQKAKTIKDLQNFLKALYANKKIEITLKEMEEKSSKINIDEGR